MTVMGRLVRNKTTQSFVKIIKWNVADRYYSVRFLRVSKGGSGEEGAERVLQKKENK